MSPRKQEYAGPDDYHDVPYPEVTFYPTDIRCNVCGLALDGDTELEAAKIDLSWVLDDVDPEDFIPENEEY